MVAPIISVCVPTYEGEPYLRECLENIAAQTLLDFEAVIVDDASTDRSFEIASEFARRDGRFTVHRNSVRLGLVGNWNRCIELSRGNWIKLLFQDDLMLPTCVERLLKGCLEYDRPLSFCRRHLLFDEQVAAETKNSYFLHEAVLDEIYSGRGYLDAEAFAECYSKKQGWNFVGEPTVTLFHRSMTKEFGKFDPGLVQLCDAEYWMRLASNVGIVHVAERLATFRVHHASTTAHNIAKRAFRMQTVDPLILTYLVLRKSYYRRLRRILYRGRCRSRIWLDFSERVYYIWKSASLLFGQPTAGEREPEWRSVLIAYPSLRVIGFIGLMLSLRNAVLRRLKLNRFIGRTAQKSGPKVHE